MALAQFNAVIALRQMTTSKLIEKMQLSLIPSEKEFMLDACDEVKRRASKWMFRRSTCQRILDDGGVELMLDIMNEWGKDEVVLRAAIRCLIPLASGPGGLCEHILELGGRKMVEEAKDRHSADDELQGVARQLLKVLLGKGALVAVKEIRLAIFCTTNAVEFGQANELLRVGSNKGRHNPSASTTDTGRDKDKAVDRSNPEATFQTDFEIVKVVIGHMMQHAADQEVQEAACDAFIAIGRNANLDAFVQTNGSELIVKAMNKFENAFQLQWKACVAVAHLAERHQGASSELGKKGVISALIASFWRFEDEITLQQQVLWALGALANHEVNVERMKNAELFRCLWGILGPKEKKSNEDEGGGLFLTVPLCLGSIWTLKELKELSKRPPPAPEEKKTKLTFKRKAKPKFGRAGEDHSDGAPGLL